MNISDGNTTDVGWLKKPTLNARQEPRRGDMWVAQRYQSLVRPQPGSPVLSGPFLLPTCNPSGIERIAVTI